MNRAVIRRIPTRRLALLGVASLLPAAAAPLRAQAVSAASPAPIQSRTGPASVGSFTYTLSASEAVLIDYQGYNGSAPSTNVSGTATFVSNSETHPTSFLYSGGYLFAEDNGQESAAYQNFGITQQLRTKNWSFVVGDFITYLPGAPVFGESGVPGVGDVGTTPISSGNIPGDSILTYYGTRVTNTTEGSVGRQLTGSTTLDGTAAYSIQRFVGNTGNGLDNNTLSFIVGPTHRIDGRNSVGANYSYSRFSFSSTDFNLTSQTAAVEYQHTFSRELSMDAAAGPQWTSSTDASISPSRVDFSLLLGLFYTARRGHYSLTYNHGTNAGSGVVLGAIADNVNFTATRSLTRRWDGSLTANYGHASSLIQNSVNDFGANSFYAGVQVSRHLSEHFSAYGSYDVEDQNLSGRANALNAFSGTAQVASVGIVFTPRSIPVGHR